jgi:hypothetical protein
MPVYDGSIRANIGILVDTVSQQPDNLNSHEFDLHRPSNKGTKLLLKVIKAIIIKPEEISLGAR